MSRCTARTGQDAAWTWSASNRPPARTSPAISSRAPRSSRMAHSEKVHTTTSTASQPPSAGRVPSPPTRRPGEGDLGRCRVVPPGHPPDQIDERLIRDSVVLGEAGGSCGELTGASDQRSGIVTGPQGPQGPTRCRCLAAVRRSRQGLSGRRSESSGGRCAFVTAVLGGLAVSRCRIPCGSAGS
jgi:hypothetical protein